MSAKLVYLKELSKRDFGLFLFWKIVLDICIITYYYVLM